VILLSSQVEPYSGGRQVSWLAADTCRLPGASQWRGQVLMPLTVGGTAADSHGFPCALSTCSGQPFVRRAHPVFHRLLYSDWSVPRPGAQSSRPALTRVVSAAIIYVLRETRQSVRGAAPGKRATVT